MLFSLIFFANEWVIYVDSSVLVVDSRGFDTCFLNFVNQDLFEMQDNTVTRGNRMKP